MSSFRYAVRTLLKAPGFSTIAISTIALGIAANTSIFSVVNGVLLRPLPFRDEGRVVKVSTATRDERDSNHSAGDFQDIRQQNRTLDAIAGFREDVVAVATKPGEPIQLEAAWVTSEFFDILGTPPALGRPFARADNAAGQKLVVLGHTAWQRLFGDDAGAAGRPVRINGDAYTVAAVMPKGFAWPQQGAKIWLLSPLPVPPSPIDMTDPLTNRDVRYFQAIARLKPGVTLVEAQQDLHAVGVAIQQQHGQTSGGRDVRATLVRENLVGDVRNALLMIQAAVGLVLLIACANVSSLLIARATGRRRELAIRAALGAGRSQLIRQLLAESLVLGVCGGVAGLLLSSWLIVLLVRFLPQGLPRTDAIALDTTVMLVTLLASVGTGLLFGILPALQASRTEAAQVIKESGERGGTRARGRAALVVAEIALTLVLLAGAGLLANSFLRLQRVDSGFKPEQVTIANLMVPQTRYPKGADQTRVFRRLLESLTERAELQAVGVGFPGPFHADNASATFSAMLIGVFALLALALAAVGVFGLVSYTVTQRTREIGIRVALGAAPRQVLMPVVREGVTLALAGIGIGLVGAIAAARALSTFLFGVGTSDPLTFLGVALLMLLVATAASYIPSRRALKVDPVVALRAE